MHNVILEAVDARAPSLVLKVREHLASIDPVLASVPTRTHYLILVLIYLPTYHRLCHRAHRTIVLIDIAVHVSREAYGFLAGSLLSVSARRSNPLEARRVALHFPHSGNALGTLTYLCGVGCFPFQCLVRFYDANAHVLQNFLS